MREYLEIQVVLGFDSEPLWLFLGILLNLPGLSIVASRPDTLCALNACSGFLSCGWDRTL